MASVQGYLVDTNVLLRLSRLDDPRQQLIRAAINELNGRGTGLYFALQSIAEFWNVCTRPTERNGFGLSIAENQPIRRTTGAHIDVPARQRAGVFNLA